MPASYRVCPACGSEWTPVLKSDTCPDCGAAFAKPDLSALKGQGGPRGAPLREPASADGHQSQQQAAAANPASTQKPSAVAPGYSAFGDVERVVLDGRRRISETIQRFERELKEQQAKIDFLREKARGWKDERDSLLKANTNYFSYTPESFVGEVDPEILEGSGGIGSLSLEREFAAGLVQSQDHARQSLYEAARRRFAGGLRKEAAAALDWLGQALADLEATASSFEEEQRETRRRKSEALIRVRAEADDSLALAVEAAREAMASLPAPMQPWTADRWRDWLPGVPCHLMFGGSMVPNFDDTLLEHGNFGAGASIPLYFPTRGNGIHLLYDNSLRERTISLCRSLLARALASIEPGRAQFRVFDPVGLGQSVTHLLELGEFDSELIGGKV